MKRIRVSAPAERDLDAIWVYLARESGSFEIADRAVESITEVFSLLASHPEAAPARDDIQPGLRGFPTGNYIVYYSVTGSRVVVAPILHAMRDQFSAFRAR